MIESLCQILPTSVYSSKTRVLSHEISDIATNRNRKLFFRFISFLRNYLVFIWTNDVFLPVFRTLWIRITCGILRTIRSFSFGSTVLLLALTRLLALRFSFDQYFFLFI